MRAGYFFWVTFFLHTIWYLYIQQLSFSWAVIGITAIIYATIAFIYLVTSDDRAGEMKMTLAATLLTLLFYALPGGIIKTFSLPELEQIVTLIVAFFPVWPIYMLYRLKTLDPDGYADMLFRIFMFIPVLILFIVFLSSFSSIARYLPDIGVQKVDVPDQVNGGLSLIWERTTKAWDDTWNFAKRASDPAAYYTGQVEENKDEPMGIEIIKLEPYDDEIANESAIVIHGLVNAKSYVQDTMTLVPSCVVDRKSDAPAATVNPSEIDLIYGTSGSAYECTFLAPEGGWKKGSYRIKSGITFPFQTWSYIEYTFVDEESAKNYAKQGLRVIDELDIPSEPTATFTSGPVKLGMGGRAPQPLLIRTEDEANGFVSPGSSVGVTLDALWGNGKLTKVNWIEIKAPPEVLLEDCDRTKTLEEPDPKAEGYTRYVFENDKTFDLATGFTSVTCKVKLKDRDTAVKLSVAGDKTIRTFVAVADYEYTTEETTTIKVR